MTRLIEDELAKLDNDQKNLDSISQHDESILVHMYELVD